MPQAIERLFATPRIRPRFPRMRPASGMHVLEWRPCGAAVLWHRAYGPASAPPSAVGWKSLHQPRWLADFQSISATRSSEIQELQSRARPVPGISATGPVLFTLKAVRRDAAR